MFPGNAAQTGVITTPLADSYTLDWTYTTGSACTSAVIADGIAVGGSGDGKVHAVDLVSGKARWTVDLAAQIVLLLHVDAPAGIYHGTNSGVASKFDMAQAVFTAAGLDAKRVLPTDSSAFVLPAPRPAYSVLGHESWASAGLDPMRDWRAALSGAHSAGAVS